MNGVQDQIDYTRKTALMTLKSSNEIYYYTG